MFEILQMDLLGKQGVFKTLKGHKISTPALIPVVDPKFQEITPKEMHSEFKVEGIITSAYLSKKRGIIENVEERGGIHNWLEFPGVIMMDSGAYQLMLYGEVDIDEKETISIQERMSPDIGVPLDIPVLPNMGKEEVEKRIYETINRLCKTQEIISNNDIIWTLPIQGGRYIDLQKKYLDEIKKRECLNFFGFYALGSVVPIMISYDYTTLIEMMRSAREEMPFTMPLHLFGAGHPMMFALATAMGYDTFDSAAYILMAKEGRYLTVNGTYNLDDLQEFPCDCKICSSYTPKEVKSMSKKERTEILARHNLYVSMAEIRNIRQAIKEGRLWDLVRERSRAHPKLFDAINKMLINKDLLKFLSLGTGSTRLSTIRVLDKKDVNRPELFRNFLEGYEKSSESAVVIILSEDSSTYHLAQEYLRKENIEEDVFIFHPILGLVPIELADTYPVNQVMFTIEAAKDTWEEKFEISKRYLLENYEKITVKENNNTGLSKKISNAFKNIMERIT